MGIFKSIGSAIVATCGTVEEVAKAAETGARALHEVTGWAEDTARDMRAEASAERAAELKKLRAELKSAV